ncbi:mediator complex, subunit Med18 [Lasiosphaeria miniovina]|uniref:Mediator of RNA polymerase II transcription subunit 18 n=1 Tax=Lasiosphaeria miniovina TaxID=1954250 RepID=A0AA40AWC7_9PEZI|nr:mediator complex, subunit Med18 [Lasiosphaeria miniovina]KAK0723257.1 mediator complex, subunit Med18 [Lasiosphaeria miniovina]
MPHEIFLTAVVNEHDFDAAVKVLGGITAMREQQHISRVHYYIRDVSVRGLPSIKEIQKEKGPTSASWQELHQILLKQSYILHTRHRDFLDPTSPGPVLRFCDQPDPESNRYPRFITQRKILEINDLRTEKILAESKFTLKSEMVEESYHWWLNDLEYALTRILPVPPGSPLPQQVSDLNDLQPLSSFWMLYVRTWVESNPERMQLAYVRLNQVKNDFTGLFEFKTMDRRAHDTRNMEPRGSV